MNNVDRMIAGLRCCAENKNVCVADECPLFEMCQANKINPLGVAAEMLAALVQQRDDAQNELAQVKRERDAAVADLTDAVKLDLTACDVCKHNGGEACLNPIGACECAMNSGKGWEWQGVQEVAEDDVKKAQIPEWISVKDKLPENDSHYLVFASDTCEVVECIYYGDGEWMTKDLENMTDCVTHWMPLPKHPKEGALNGV